MAVCPAVHPRQHGLQLLQELSALQRCRRLCQLHALRRPVVRGESRPAPGPQDLLKVELAPGLSADLLKLARPCIKFPDAAWDPATSLSMGAWRLRTSRKQLICA